MTAMIKMSVAFLTVGLGLISACSGDDATSVSTSSSSNISSPTETDLSLRWYRPDQVSQGEKIYSRHCIACHKEKATGTTQWKKRLDDGSFPPPPLNGTAHAWHHSLDVLTSVISQGGIPMGGKMPAFGQVLSKGEKAAVIAYFQSFWSDEIYQRWKAVNDG